MKFSAIALPLALMMAAGTATAAEPIQKRFNLVGTLPAEFFAVQDIGGWWNTNHELEWQEGQGFAAMNKRLMMRSSVGAITAHLTRPAELISASDDVIPMRLSVGGKTLTSQPQEVASSEELLAGRPISKEFDLSAASATVPRPGDYSGTFGMMFETAPPL